MTSEDRLSRQFEPACQKYAEQYDIHGLDKDDLTQELRLAALRGIRTYDPTKGRALATHVIATIRWRVAALLHLRKDPRFKKYKIDPYLLSLDWPLSDETTDTYADTLVSPERADTSLLRIACETFCLGDIDSEILDAIEDGTSLTDLGRKWGVSRQYVGQLKDRLLARLRAELA
jgi:DNA-directed RNA polymerase specialized sigma subunit